MDKIAPYSRDQFCSMFTISNGRRAFGVVGWLGAAVLEVGGIFVLTNTLSISRVSFLKVSRHPTWLTALGGMSMVAGGIFFMLSAGALFSNSFSGVVRSKRQLHSADLLPIDPEQLTFDMLDLPVVIDGQATHFGSYPDSVQICLEGAICDLKASDERVDLEVIKPDGTKAIYNSTPIYYQTQSDSKNLPSHDAFFVVYDVSAVHDAFPTLYRVTQQF